MINDPAMVDAVREDPKWRPRARLLHVWILDDGAFSAIEFCYLYRHLHERIAKIIANTSSRATAKWSAGPEFGGYVHLIHGNRAALISRGRVACRPAETADVGTLCKIWDSQMPLAGWLVRVRHQDGLAQESKTMIAKVVAAGKAAA